MLVAFSVVIMATVAAEEEVVVAAAVVAVTEETMATATLSAAGEVEEAVTSKTLSVFVDIQWVGLTEGVNLTKVNLLNIIGA